MSDSEGLRWIIFRLESQKLSLDSQITYPFKTTVMVQTYDETSLKFNIWEWRKGNIFQWESMSVDPQ